MKHLTLKMGVFGSTYDTVVECRDDGIAEGHAVIFGLDVHGYLGGDFWLVPGSDFTCCSFAKRLRISSNVPMVR